MTQKNSFKIKRNKNFSKETKKKDTAKHLVSKKRSIKLEEKIRPEKQENTYIKNIDKSKNKNALLINHSKLDEKPKELFTPNISFPSRHRLREKNIQGEINYSEASPKTVTAFNPLSSSHSASAVNKLYFDGQLAGLPIITAVEFRKSAKKPQTLYKYLAEEWGNKMLEEGNIRIGNLYEYRTHWNDQIKDEEEATYNSVQHIDRYIGSGENIPGPLGKVVKVGNNSITIVNTNIRQGASKSNGLDLSTTVCNAVS